MKRHYISHAPRFGSYKNPVHWKIEQSPYFYWWLCLLYGSKFLQKEPQISLPQLEDFGEIICGDDKYISFTNWWLKKMPNGETRGEYLFAEQFKEKGTRLVNDVAEAERVLTDDSYVLVRIDLNSRRKVIDSSLDKILRKVGAFKKGRAVNTSSLSTARYRLSKPVQLNAIKRILHVYELKETMPSLSNYEVYKRIGHKIDRYDDETAGSYMRRVSTFISRDYSNAKRLVENACKGQFP